MIVIFIFEKVLELVKLCVEIICKCEIIICVCVCIIGKMIVVELDV